MDRPEAEDLPVRLRAVGGYHWGVDLPERVASAVAWQIQQSSLMQLAADEIDRLKAELAALRANT